MQVNSADGVRAHGTTTKRRDKHRKQIHANKVHC